MELMVLNESFGRYIATVAERVTKRQLQLIATGTKVQDVHVVPTEVELYPIEPGDSRQRNRIVVSWLVVKQDYIVIFCKCNWLNWTRKSIDTKINHNSKVNIIESPKPLLGSAGL
jgi:hypothetical protein